MSLLTKKTRLALSISIAMGGAAACLDAHAAIIDFSWTGQFVLLDPNGNPLDNLAIAAKANGYVTPISGTLTWDTYLASGTADIVDFSWDGDLTLPAGFSLVDVDGPLGSGSLVLGNALANWNGNNDIPVSAVWDASGLFSAIDGGLTAGDTISGVGAVPASDGSYTNFTFGYLAAGPSPLATTTFNTSNAPGCIFNACTGVNPSGVLPLVLDTAENSNIGYYTPGNTLGIAGSPLQDGPFLNFNWNFDITSLQVTSVSTVPVPAAFWLFCSGLFGLMGIARRKS